MKSILVTGCNRGLGLGLIRHLVQDQNPPSKIIATCRNIEQAKNLREIADQHKNVSLVEFDVRNFNQYSDFSKQVESIVESDGLNVLYNNAGISQKFTRIQYVKADQLLETYSVNTIAPIMLTKALLPLLKQAAKNNQDLPLGANKAMVVNMSSILASIQQNKDGGFYPYRCSKAALNMATKSLSVDLRNDGILVTGIHPGWVKTDLGGANAPLSVDESINAILKFIKSANETHAGGFYQWDGKQLSW